MKISIVMKKKYYQKIISNGENNKENINENNRNERIMKNQ